MRERSLVIALIVILITAIVGVFMYAQGLINSKNNSGYTLLSFSHTQQQTPYSNPTNFAVEIENLEKKDTVYHMEYQLNGQVVSSNFQPIKYGKITSVPAPKSLLDAATQFSDQSFVYKVTLQWERGEQSIYKRITK
jgi:flagellar basal body-associated protein FliL